MKSNMSSGTTLVNPSPPLVTQHYHPLGFGAQLNMLDCKMSNSSLSPVAPGNILSECYIGMWDTEMAHPPPTKLETTDIMDLIEPSLNNAGASHNGPATEEGGGLEAGGTCSPTTIIHHTGEPHHDHHHHRHQNLSDGPQSTSYPSSTCTSSSSPSSSSTTSSTSSYLAPLPSLGDPYGQTSTECHLLDGFHGGMEPPFHKFSEAPHPFQEGGYDAFISDMSHPPTSGSLSDGNPNPHHHHHHQHHQHQGHEHAHQQHHPHHQAHPLHLTSHSHLQSVSGMAAQCHDNNNGVLLLDMSNQHHHLQGGSGTQCSPGCACGGNPFPLGGETLDLCPPPGVLVQGHHQPHPHTLSLHHHNPQHRNPHQQEYPSTWEDLHCEPGDYSILFRKGESPSTTDSVSYTDNDSESKSSGGSLSGITEIAHVSPPKRKVGRPPKKDKKLKRNEKKTGRLWEFIRDLLKNPEYCPSLVKWENHEEGHFRFVNSEKVAQLWGKIKGNPRMTYEKLSRAMRYYYKSHVFEPVLGRRLVYKFGYNATNWKPINPNFASSHPKMYN